MLGVALAVGMGVAATAQTLEVRQWQGQTANSRQSEQVVAQTPAEWRSLWTRVGVAPPDLFEPGRTTAVGIFLGPRASGHAVNLLSTSRRRDRIVVVFEERLPPGGDSMMATRSAAPQPKAVASPPPMPAGSAGFAGNSAPTTSTLVAPPPAPAAMASRAPAAPSTSPWAIILINRVDLPISVEQRLFR